MTLDYEFEEKKKLIFEKIYLFYKNRLSKDVMKISDVVSHSKLANYETRKILESLLREDLILTPDRLPYIPNGDIVILLSEKGLEKAYQKLRTDKIREQIALEREQDKIDKKRADKKFWSWFIGIGVGIVLVILIFIITHFVFV